ncbi:response regulator transcription factor [Enterococcus sp. LJL98]
MKKVVILDDEKIIVDGLSYFLEQRFSRELTIVRTYQHAEEAIVDLENLTFDVLITDICMLDMTGLELIKSLKQNKDFESIIISAYHNFDYAQKSIDLGVRTYLTKPIDFEKLSEVLSKILLEKKKNNLPEHLNETYSPVINQLLQRIKENYHQDLQLSTLAEELHYNPAYLGQLFHKEVKKNFNTYVIQRRLKESKLLLTRTSLSIDEISNEVGFKNPAYFIQMFKRNFGTTPLQYRKLWLK